MDVRGCYCALAACEMLGLDKQVWIRLMLLTIVGQDIRGPSAGSMRTGTPHASHLSCIRPKLSSCMATLLLSASLQAIADACGMVDFIRRCQVRSAVPAAHAATACCLHGRHPQLWTPPLGTLQASAMHGCKIGGNLLLTQKHSSLPKSSLPTCHPLCCAVARGRGGRRALERGARRLLLLRPGRGRAAGQGAAGRMAACGGLLCRAQCHSVCPLM